MGLSREFLVGHPSDHGSLNGVANTERMPRFAPPQLVEERIFSKLYQDTNFVRRPVCHLNILKM